MVENFFQDLEAEGKIDMTSDMDKVCGIASLASSKQIAMLSKNIGTLIIFGDQGILQ